MIDKNNISLIIEQFYDKPYYVIGDEFTTIYLTTSKKHVFIYYTQQNWFGKVYINKMLLTYPISCKNFYLMEIHIHIDLFLTKKRQLLLNKILND